MMDSSAQHEIEKTNIFKTIGNINFPKTEDQFKNGARTEDFYLPYYFKREISGLPPSAKFIIYLLKMKGVMNRKEIIQATLMPDRTVGFALKMLKEKSLIEITDPKTLNSGASQSRRKRRMKVDRRITNYNLSSSIMPYLMSSIS
jgi:hypothetical protein